jgi:RND family efflux transporter MFP subunit
LLAAGALVGCCLLFIPVTYHVAGSASLQGAYKQLVVSPQDGYLAEINARPGDLVQAGDLLAQLNDDDLRLERRKLSSEQKRFQQQYDNALATANRIEAAIASAQVDQVAIQLRLLEQQLQRTQLVAPRAGIVVSKDITQTLGAPVKQGDTLFEIAADGFQVQLWIDERDIAAVQIGHLGQLKLSSLPGEVFALAVTRIMPLSEVREGRNYFHVEATLATEAQVLRPGMSGSAKLEVGERRLGWLWFNELWRWFRLNIWW